MKSNFQIILLGVFVVFILVGIVIFASIKGGSNQDLPQVSIWGTVDDQIFSSFLNKYIIDNDRQQLKISYVQVSSENFEQTLIEALAGGRGPDIVILPQNMIVKQQDKIYHIPYQVYDERTFSDTFIDEGGLFLWDDGIVGFPFVVNPLVMYWNKDIFSSETIATYPKYWDEFFGLNEKLTKLDSKLNIKRSAVALGEYVNINYAKDVLSAMIFQAGNPIVEKNNNGGVTAVLNQRYSANLNPAEAALSFYTEFSNPAKLAYSWNRAMSTSKDSFISGNLAVYLGKASDIKEIRTKNPNLNFDVALLPGLRDSKTKVTFADIQGLAILKTSKNISASLSVVNELTSNASQSVWMGISLLPSTRRDLLGKSGLPAYMSVFNDSAIMAHGWLDPDSSITDKIFKEMIESVTSGKARVSEAVNRASLGLQEIIK